MSAFSYWERLDPPRKLILVSSLGLAALLIWAAFAEVDSITRGTGRVIPSSKAQLVQPSEPAVVDEILVRSGQSVEEGQLLVRLDDAQSASELGQLQIENERLAARAERLSQEAGGGSFGCEEGSICADERQLQQARVGAAKARERSLAAAVDQRRKDLQEAEATVASLRESVRLAREQVSMLAPLAAHCAADRTAHCPARSDRSSRAAFCSRAIIRAIRSCYSPGSSRSELRAIGIPPAGPG